MASFQKGRVGEFPYWVTAAFSFLLPFLTSPPRSCSFPFFGELWGVSWGQVLKLELFGQHSNHCPQNWWSRTNLPEILITGPALGGQEPAAVVSRATNIAEKGHKKMPRGSWPRPLRVKELRGGPEIVVSKGGYSGVIVPNVSWDSDLPPSGPGCSPVQGPCCGPPGWAFCVCPSPGVHLVLQSPVCFVCSVLTLGCISIAPPFLPSSAGIPFLILSHTWEHQCQRAK